MPERSRIDDEATETDDAPRVGPALRRFRRLGRDVRGTTAAFEAAREVSDSARAEGNVPSRVLRRDSQRRRVLAVADSAAVLIALSISLLGFGRATRGDLVLLVVIPVWVLMHKVGGLYDRDAGRIHMATLDESPRLLQMVVLGSFLLFLLSPLVPAGQMNRGQVVVFAATSALLLLALRSAARSLLMRLQVPERVVIVGSGSVARLIERKLAAHPEYGVALIGRIGSDGPEGRGAYTETIPVLGEVEHFEKTCREHDVERAVIAFGVTSDDEMLVVIRASRRLGVRTTVVPRLHEVIGHAVELDDVEGMTLLGLRDLSRTTSSLLLKRAIDISLSALALLLLSPLLAVLALLVKLTSPGPVLFAQWRIGRHGSPFRMLKFRTMVADAEEHKSDLAHLNEAAPMFKIADDPRITPVGSWLRRRSLDELPQLWNILRGEMSLVGPRPLIEDESAQVLGHFRDRLQLTPGLTGPWQVLGRTKIPFEEMIRLDYLYVAEWSLWNDIKLLLRTAPVVFRARGH